MRELTSSPRPIRIAAYDPAWPGLFECERYRILAAIPDLDFKVEAYADAKSNFVRAIETMALREAS